MANCLELNEQVILYDETGGVSVRLSSAWEQMARFDTMVLLILTK